MKNIILAALLYSVCSPSLGQETFKYVTSPADNPLKGLVPYSGDKRELFPHSMEFNYLPLSDLVTGERKYNWQPLENLLNDVSKRGHQTVFRVWMEYPGHTDGIPSYLEEAGVEVTEWLNTNTQPFPPTKVRTPDYDDPRVRRCLQDFISELGKRYDGDSRIAFITAGLLGTWGEWHTYPRNDLMANKIVQSEVLDAYESAFETTQILLRYPAGENNYAHSANHLRGFGYHDDSFAWATLDTGNDQDSWFFMPSLALAGPEALHKWKLHAIGGEIRPELWGQIFDVNPEHPRAQDFAKCVQQTHASWMLDTGMFKEPQSSDRIDRAKQQIARMGYDFHISSASIKRVAEDLHLSVGVQNRGVAPFYYDWKIIVGIFNGRTSSPTKTLQTDWSIKSFLPAVVAREWKLQIKKDDLPPDARFVAVRVVNPMDGGLPLRFANSSKRQLENGWLRVATLPQ